MLDPLPKFPYHPDPVATGSVRPSRSVCVCCGRGRGYVYTGPIFTSHDLDGELCPWCIGDGSACRRYEACFTGDPIGENVATEVVAAVDTRTPGFHSWQSPRWFYHCGDGTSFRGRAHASALAAWPHAWDMVREEAVSAVGHDAADRLLAELTEDGEVTALLFVCRSCQTGLAYLDFS